MLINLFLKDPTIRESLINMTEMVAKALHPTNLRERIAFRSKGELLRHMEAFVLAEKGISLTTRTCALAMDSCTALLYPFGALRKDYTKIVM